jgi:hypothetical protein
MFLNTPVLFAWNLLGAQHPTGSMQTKEDIYAKE